MTESDVIQTGGVVAFASVVLLLLRRLEPLLTGLKSELTEMRITFAAWLERERIRDERRKRETSQPPVTKHSKMPSLDVPRDEFDREESTDIKVIAERIREEQKRPRGVRAPTRGEHHDKGG